MRQAREPGDAPVARRPSPRLGRDRPRVLMAHGRPRISEINDAHALAPASSSSSWRATMQAMCFASLFKTSLMEAAIV
jgi:hypothetical protein